MDHLPDSTSDLVGDGSGPYSLPTIKRVKHDRFKRIDAAILVKLIDGHFDNCINSFTIVDCRYPYEYLGGHIVNSINLHTSDDIIKFFIDRQTNDKSLVVVAPHHQSSCTTSNNSSNNNNINSNAPPSKTRHVVIFHCEFSSERGPKLMKFLREKDRQINMYPELSYPEIYLLDGGYKEFYHKYKQYCVPQSYKPMKCKDNRDDLHRFKKQNRSRKRVRKENLIPEISFEGC